MQIKCDKCGGKGEVELHEPYTSMFKLVQEKGPISSQEITDQLTESVTVPAINNRLEYLRGLGLIDRSKVGRSWLYSAAA